MTDLVERRNTEHRAALIKVAVRAWDTWSNSPTPSLPASALTALKEAREDLGTLFTMLVPHPDAQNLISDVLATIDSVFAEIGGGT